jgi:hypothetical protein
MFLFLENAACSLAWDNTLYNLLTQQGVSETTAVGELSLFHDDVLVMEHARFNI